MANGLANLAQFEHTLPYGSEAFGLYQPLLGWRSTRAVQRVVAGVVRNQSDLIAMTSRQIVAAVQMMPADPGIDRLASGVASDQRAYSPLIASHIADVLSQKLDGADLADTGTWSSLLNRGTVDDLLAESVVPALNQVVQGTGQSAEQQTQYLEESARRESVIAGTLVLLADQGRHDVLRTLFAPATAHGASAPSALLDPLAVFDPARDWGAVGLSPVGIVHLFRQYFFEFDTFLGPPVQHLWLSPGGTVELIEASTRKTTVERTTEQSVDTTSSTDRSATTQDDLSEAAKRDNESNIKLGASVTANERWGWGDATETSSLDYSTTEQVARETTHKTMRQQSAKLTTEIKKNFKTTFRTVTETTDTTSRRYVLSNTTDHLVNYELRRKMRQVGVQVQDLGAQLCWQSFVDNPGADLDISRLLHIAAPPDFSNLGPIDELTTPDDYTIDISGSFSLRLQGGGNDVRGWPVCYLSLHPKDGFEYLDHGELKWSSSGSFSTEIRPNGAGPNTIAILGQPPNSPYLLVWATWGNGHEGEEFSFTLPVTFTPTTEKLNAISERNKVLLKERSEERDRLIREAYMTSVVDRVKVASNIQPRSFDDLRDEERIVVFRKLVQDLCAVGGVNTSDRAILHKASELISTIFDVDAMLYFVAPEWWRPHTHARSEEPSPDIAVPPEAVGSPSSQPTSGSLRKQNVSIVTGSAGIDVNSVRPVSDAVQRGRGSYDITGDSTPAHFGVSLGWLLQLDGDNQRNAFLNAPWVKAVVPIRPGREFSAMNWLGHPGIEGSDGLDERYQQSREGELERIALGLEGYAWPAGEQHDRYVDFTQRLAADPAAMFVSVRDALTFLAIRIQAMHTAGNEVVNEDLGNGVTLSYLRPDMVYEHGFDPLQGGFRANSVAGDEYKPFTQWTEVLPTDQIVAVEVTYDPGTGRQI